MKRVLFFIMVALVAQSAMAQPKARRQQAQAQKQQQSQTATATQQQNQGISQRARLMYPTSLDMPEDVVWRRDIYREINLDDEANSGLYYPVEPIDRQMNLFTYVFKLALNGYIPIYEYRLDGNESFSDSSKVAIKTMLDNYHILYETRDGKIRVENSDIPSAEVKMYYLKESAYYDQSNAQFRRKVMALCPVMVREDDFGGEAAKYPLFWIKYTDLEPYLSRQSVQASDLNNAATMTLEDYFTLNHYQGKIYKAGNRMSQTQQRPQFGDFDMASADNAAKKEQEKIEKELLAFERGMFGHTPQRDSLDSIAKIQPENEKVAKKSSRSSRRTRAPKVKSSKKSSDGSASSSSSAPRVSVRRQRH
jgi:gliding motility associated protien GldN